MKTNLQNQIAIFTAGISRRNCWRTAVTVFSLALAAGSGVAAQKTWNGGGANLLWSSAANWGGSAVANGDDLLFTGAVKLNNTNDIITLNLNSIEYSASGFLNIPLTNGPGYTIMITNGIVDVSGNNTNNIPFILGGSQSISNQAGGTTLVLGGTINMSNRNLTIGGAGNTFLNGIVSGNGAVGVNSVNISDGLIRLAAANTFNGDVTVNSGTLQLGNAGGIPSGNAKGNLNLLSGANLDLGNSSPTINALNGAGTIDENPTTNISNLTITLGTANSNGVFSGTINNTRGTVAVIKNGTGSQTFLAAQNYVGATTINQGVLALTNGGSILSTNITIGAGGTLILDTPAGIPQNATAVNLTIAPTGVFDFSRANGAGGYAFFGNLSVGRSSAFATDIAGNLGFYGGNLTIRPGAAGTLTLNGNLTLSGGTLNYDLNTATTVGAGVNDLITSTGTIDISGGTTLVKIKPISGSVGGTYTLMTSAHPIVGGPANLQLAGPRGITATFDTTTQPNNVLVTAAGAPNPASLVWAGNGSGGPWDAQVTQSWLSNSVPDYFYDLDFVTFNDAAGTANSTVSFPNAVTPSATVVSNSTAVFYTFGAANVDQGLIAGTGSLTKSGPGTLVLNTANSYTGDTIVNGGTLILGMNLTGSFVNSSVVYNNVPSANLILGNGGIYAAVQANSSLVDIFTNLTLNPGGSSIGERNRQSNVTTYSLQFWGVTRNVGATLDLSNVQTRSGSPNCGIFITNNLPLANGILGGYATFNENDWVVPVINNTGASLGSFAYTAYQVNATSSAWLANTNINVTTTPTAIAANQVVNSLRVPAAVTVTINAGQSLTLASGGLLVPNNATGAGTITGGTLKGSTNGDLVVLENNLANALTIGSVIADNVGATALTKSGQGTLILTGNNTYSGATYINGATIQGSGNATPATPFGAGVLQVGAGGTSGAISNSSSVVNYGTLAFNRSDTLGYTGTISGPGGLKQQGAGTTILTANNTYAGATTITAGTLQIGNGGATGSFSNSASVANAGSLVINRTGSLAYGGQISGIGSLTLQGGVTVTLNTNELYSGNTIVSAGTLALGTTGSISNSPLITVAGGAALNATASGGLGLNSQVLAGSGTVSGNVTAGNATRISPGGDGAIGTLTLANDLLLNGGTVTIDVNGGSRDLLNVQNLNLTSGSIAINNLGAALANGTYKLIGYSGTLSGNVANISVSGFSQIGQLASLSSSVAGEIDLVVVTGFGANLTWLGDNAANLWNTALAANFTNSAGVASTFHNNDNVNFTDAGAANSTVNLVGSLSPASVLVNSTTDYTLQGSGAVSGGSSLVKSGSDNLIVLTTNSLTGSTTINGGTLTLGNGVSDGTLGIGSIINNSVLVVNEAGAETLSGDISGAGTVNLTGPGKVTFTGNNTSFSGPLTVSAGVAQVGAGGAAGTLGTGAMTNNGVLLINRSGSLTVGASIAGTGPLTNSGPGLVTLSGVNTYSGLTVIANGTIKAGSTGALPNGTGLGNVVLNGGTPAGVLDLNGFDVNINGLDGINGATLGQVINNSGTSNRLVLGNGDAAGTFSGTIKDGSSKITLVKVGAGTQTLDVPTATANSFSGGIILSNGVLDVTSPGGGNPVNLNASQAALGSAPITFYGGALSFAGSFQPINQNSGPTWNAWSGTLIVPALQNGTVHGPQRGQINPTLQGSGTLLYQTAYVRGQLGGDCTAFTGRIILAGDSNGGNLGLNTAATPGFPNARVFLTNGINIYNQVAGTPTIPIGELSGDNATVVQLSGTEAGNNNAALAANFAIGGLNTSTNFPGSIIDNVGIIKVGTGRLSLDSSIITYTGITTVSNGILAFTAALPATSPTYTLAAPGILDVSAVGTLTVGNTAQTIQGNGTLNGSLAVGGSGTVVVGFTNAIGTLTVTNDINLGGTTYMELNRTNSVGGTNDQIAASTIELGGTLTVTNIGPALHVGDTFKLFKATSALSGSLGAVNLPATDANNMSYTWTDNTAANGSITVLTAVSLVNTAPTNITAVVSGNVLTLSWPTDHTGWYLQLQTNALTTGLYTNWVTLPGSQLVNTTNMTINPGNGSVFYRMSLNP